MAGEHHTRVPKKLSHSLIKGSYINLHHVNFVVFFFLLSSFSITNRAKTKGVKRGICPEHQSRRGAVKDLVRRSMQKANNEMLSKSKRSWNLKTKVNILFVDFILFVLNRAGFTIK